MSNQLFPVISASVYNDDVVKPADCRVDTAQAHSLAEMLFQVGRLEKLRPAASKLLGNFRPREVLRAAKERAINGGQAAVVCVDKTTVGLVMLRPEDEQSVYRLANLAARGFVLGVMVFNPDKSINCYPQADEEMELKSLLLNFFARMVNKVRALDADDLSALSADENFAASNVETTLDRYSEWSDRNPVDIHDHITYGNRTGE
jgi:hypothetical protein